MDCLPREGVVHSPRYKALADHWWAKCVKAVLRRVALLSQCNDAVVADSASWLLKADRAEFSRRADEKQKTAEHHAAEKEKMEAVATYLVDHKYENIDAAAMALGTTHEQVWAKILADAGLPHSEMPASIQIR